MFWYPIMLKMMKVIKNNSFNDITKLFYTVLDLGNFS